MTLFRTGGPPSAASGASGRRSIRGRRRRWTSVTHLDVPSVRKVAFLLGTVGCALALIGDGVGAQFTGWTTSSHSVTAGRLSISVSSTTPGAVVVNSGAGLRSVTLTCGEIDSSLASSCPLEFTVTNTGNIKASLTVTVASGPGSPFYDLYPGNVANPALGAGVTIAPGGHQDYSGGLGWPDLTNSNLGQSASITYTVSATG